jgi:hypothetical protein
LTLMKSLVESDADPKKRDFAARQLGLSRDANTLNFLLERFEAEKLVEVRIGILAGLSYTERPEAIAVVTKNLFDNPLPEIRIAAADSLPKTKGNADTIDAVTKAVSVEKNVEARKKMILILGDMWFWYNRNPKLAQRITEELIKLGTIEKDSQFIETAGQALDRVLSHNWDHNSTSIKAIKEILKTQINPEFRKQLVTSFKSNSIKLDQIEIDGPMVEPTLDF